MDIKGLCIGFIALMILIASQILLDNSGYIDESIAKKPNNICKSTCEKMNATHTVYYEDFFDSRCTCIVDNQSIKLW